MLKLVERWKHHGEDWFDPVYWGNGTDPGDVNPGKGPKIKWLGPCADLNATADECFKFYKYEMGPPFAFVVAR